MIFAYYKAEREFQVEEYKNIEKIEFQDKYSIAENPGIKFTKYLVDLKATQAFTKDKEKAEKINKWFHAFENINDLIIRMEAKSGLRTAFDMEGVVLVDEIETHLHLELQKKVLPILIALFPNIQFIITTHSPFILSSIDNAVIYDLQNRTRVENGLENLPYEGIVEGYFKADTLSAELREKFERYQAD